MQSVSYDAAEAGEIVEHVSEIRGGRAGQTGTAACPGQGRSAYTSARPSPAGVEPAFGDREGPPRGISWRRRARRSGRRKRRARYKPIVTDRRS